jgi:hypothetical protein
MRGPACVLEQIPGLEAALQHENLVPHQIGDRQAPAARQPVLTRHDGQHAKWVQRPALESLRAERSDRKMELSLVHPYEQRARAVLRHLHLDARPCSMISRQHLWQGRLDELRSRPDPEHPALTTAERLRTFSERLGIGQDPSGST